MRGTRQGEKDFYRRSLMNAERREWGSQTVSVTGFISPFTILWT